MTNNIFRQQSFEDAELKKSDVVEEEGKPDPLTQLVTTFCRGAMTERSGALQVRNKSIKSIGCIQPFLTSYCWSRISLQF